MRFTTFAIAAFTAFASVNAQLSPGGVVGAIEEITDISSNTNEILQDLKAGNIFSAIPRAIAGLNNIVQTATKDVAMLASAGNVKFPEDGQKDVCKAFTGFVKVHQNLLETVIGTKGLLSNTPFTALIAAALRGLEGIVDKLAFSIIGLVPSCAEQAKMDAKSLTDTLDKAIKAYSFKFPFGQKV